MDLEQHIGEEILKKNPLNLYSGSEYGLEMATNFMRVCNHRFDSWIALPVIPQYWLFSHHYMGLQKSKRKTMSPRCMQQLAQVFGVKAQPSRLYRKPTSPTKTNQVFYLQTVSRMNNKQQIKNQELVMPFEYLHFVPVFPALKFHRAITLWTARNRVRAMSIKIMQIFFFIQGIYDAFTYA